MDYIRVTMDNLEKEHICCAISNNKDVQVSSKKAWLADRFGEGLVFLKSALSNISRRKMHGSLSLPTGICILTVCGYPGRSRVTDIHQIC